MNLLCNDSTRPDAVRQEVGCSSSSPDAQAERYLRRRVSLQCRVVSIDRLRELHYDDQRVDHWKGASDAGLSQEEEGYRERGKNKSLAVIVKQPCYPLIDVSVRVQIGYCDQPGIERYDVPDDRERIPSSSPDERREDVDVSDRRDDPANVSLVEWHRVGSV